MEEKSTIDKSMSGGISMISRKNNSSLIVLSGEKGVKLFHEILNSPKTPYNPKQKSKEAKKELRKQGFYV